MHVLNSCVRQHLYDDEEDSGSSRPQICSPPEIKLEIQARNKTVIPWKAVNSGVHYATFYRKAG